MDSGAPTNGVPADVDFPDVVEVSVGWFSAVMNVAVFNATWTIGGTKSSGAVWGCALVANGSCSCCSVVVFQLRW